MEGTDTILGINRIILTDDKVKAQQLNFYFTFIFYVKEKDWLDRREQILGWENWRPTQMGRTTESLVLNVFESLLGVVRSFWGTRQKTEIVLDDGGSVTSQLSKRTPTTSQEWATLLMYLWLQPPMESWTPRLNCRHLGYLKSLTTHSDAMPGRKLCYKSMKLIPTLAKLLNIMLLLFETPVCEHMKSKWIFVKSQHEFKISKPFQTDFIFFFIERSLYISIFSKLFHGTLVLQDIYSYCKH